MKIEKIFKLSLMVFSSVFVPSTGEHCMLTREQILLTSLINKPKSKTISSVQI